MIVRKATEKIISDLTYFPVIGIVGPRQVGKTTLSKHLQQIISKESIYLDLELTSDQNKLTDAETYLRLNEGKCVIIDEIQLMPELFALLRSLVDIKRVPARFILLGSASPTLIRDASESLAGRIAYTELTPFGLIEISKNVEMRTHWFRGGFPDALLAPSPQISKRWVKNFVETFIQRDLRDLGHEVSSSTLTKLLTMLAHLHGQLLNTAELSRSLGISSPTVNRYIDLLEGSFIINRLTPYFRNVKKRLVKSPKIYVRDSGILHHLLNIANLDNLYSQPIVGASWEGYVVEQLQRHLSDDWKYHFYRTHQGAETDLILISPENKMTCIEIKYSNSPKVSRGFYSTLEDLNPDQIIVLKPEGEAYPIKEDVWVWGLKEWLETL